MRGSRALHAVLWCALTCALLLTAPRPVAARAPPVGDGVDVPLGMGEQNLERPRLVVYWGVGCPHCESAMPFVLSLERDGGLVVELVEIRRDAAGRDRFLAEVQRLGLVAPGIPLFVLGDRHVMGFREGVTEEQIRAIIRDAAAGKPASAAEEVARIDLPWFGRIEPGAHSLTALALIVGLVDGINPCAMYVLVAMLGILLHVRSRRRVFLFGGTFVVMSGVVYFIFMTAWLNLFALTGLSRGITVLLGMALVVMGLVNLKELAWFKKGVSLMIPTKAKPGLFRRMRGVASAATLPAALAGVAVLAFVVNLVELGCTLGLPAVFTRILSLQTELTLAERYGLLVLYNLAYVVPLAAVVLVVGLTLHRVNFSERAAKGLKLVSGVLLIGFGVLFVAAPEVLHENIVRFDNRSMF
ncbi:NrdH-redoxin [Polyangium fumosum]|uniref:Thioredoxin domain-containing protein n=1 Tax=Polyangium fumosum TaxID=889272 RepID=A0A4U1JET1_9BACT|nr:NrdH-redoxin [Polyangium fumosum]TKD08653.1 hypothetical protein E8A74_15340 [Polyangium fumosum]